MISIKKLASISLITTMALGLVGCGGGGMSAVTDIDENELPISEIATGTYHPGVSLHDPQVWVEGEGDYWMYGTHMTQASGTSLSDWTMFADGVRPTNKIFSNLFDKEEGEELPAAFAFVGKNTDRGYSVWAPSVIYNKAMGKYMMYFCTTSTYIKSNICYAVSDTPEGPYEYVDTILYSGFVKSDIEKTDFYEVMGADVDLKPYVSANNFNNTDWPNCIDPALFYDEDDRLWMVYGSWSGGIFLIEIDEETGDVIHPEADPENNVDHYYGKRLVGGGHHAIEGPYIHYDKESGYYYLFVSYGELRAEGGYQVRQFRSDKVDGDYVDITGTTPWNQDDFSDYGIKMMGNYKFPSMDRGYMAPGGQSSFVDNDGRLYLVYHQRFDGGGENHEPRIHQMFANEDGWLVAAPFQTAGESLSADGYTNADICGTYYVLGHGVGINSNLIEAEECKFSTDGSFTGSKEGTFEVKDGTCFITLTTGGVEYKGVILDMPDEAGNNTRCFMAVGTNNKTLWGVHYVK